MPIACARCAHCAHCSRCAHCAHCAQVELAKRSGYVVVSGDGAGKLYYVKNITKADGKQYEVDMRRGMDTVDCCEHVWQHNQPCRHMVCVFWQQNMLSNQRKMKQVVHDFWPKWAVAENYVRAYAGQRIARPEIYAGKFTGNPDECLGAPKQKKKKRGRPKKQRYRFRGKTVQDIKDVMPTVYHAEYASCLEYF